MMLYTESDLLSYSGQYGILRLAAAFEGGSFTSLTSTEHLTRGLRIAYGALHVHMPSTCITFPSYGPFLPAVRTLDDQISYISYERGLIYLRPVKSTTQEKGLYFHITNGWSEMRNVLTPQ